MNFYQANFTTSYLFTGVVLGILSLVIYFKNTRNPVNITFSLYSLSIAWWSLFSVFMIIADSEKSATFWDKICLMGVVFIPTTFLHFTFTFLKEIPQRKRFIKICYLLSFVFFVLNFTPYFIKTTGPVYKLNYFTIPGPGYLVFLVYYSLAVVYGIYLLYHALRKSRTGLYRQQLLYLFWGTLLGYSGGSLNYNLVLGFPPYEIVPWGNYLIGIYGLLIAYAIAKYRLMDIKLAFTRASIFICVYTLVLGIPFGLAVWSRAWLTGMFGQGWLWIPMICLLLLATTGPFIYLYLQREAENRLLAEQKQYQTTLRQASMGMARIKDLNRLLNLIVHVLSRTVRIEHCAIYLLDGTQGNYTLKASRGIKSRKREMPRELEQDSALISRLRSDQNPIVYEEIKQQATDNQDEDLKKVIIAVQKLEAELVVPSLDGENLIAVIVLGKKKSGEMYSSDDLLVFSILANQSALGIENALFYEETGKGLVEKFHEKRLKFLGELGSGVAHQMNNRFNVMSMAAGVGLEEIEEKDINMLSREELIRIINYNKGILEKIESSALKGKEIAEAIKTYSKASVVPSAVTLEKSIASSLNLLACKFKIEYLNVKKEYMPDTYVWANLSTIQEVISNAIDNSHDAMRTKEGLVRSKELDIKEYKPELVIRANSENNKLKIEIIDNGIGMTQEELDKVFVPFFTTKGASKGTGMGLNMMKQLLEKNQGAIEIDSKYKQGTKVTLKVPLATEEQIRQTKEEMGES